MPKAKAINLFSAVSPIEYGATMDEIAEMLREKTVDTLTQNCPTGHVLIRGDDGRLYSFDLRVVPVKLDKAEEMEAIIQTCPYVFISQDTGVTEESLLDFDAPAKYVKVFKVCVAKNAEAAQNQKYTCVTTRQTKHAAIQFCNKHFKTTFDKTYECRPATNKIISSKS
jgi:hypothetical protein